MKISNFRSFLYKNSVSWNILVPHGVRRLDERDDSMEKQVLHDATDRVQIFRLAAQPEMRLICCPHAGASASAFSPLSSALPDRIEALVLQYPGRVGAKADGGFSDIRELADQLTGELRSWADRPVAVFGHSMGSVIAFEVTRRLEDAGVGPLRLFVSGRRSPSAGLGVRTQLSDEEIINELSALGGMPRRFLDKPKFRDSILSVVRNDFRANSRYLAPPDATVDCPITFLLAELDPYVDEAGARTWAIHTTRELKVTRFSGGHFFFNEQLPEVVAAMAGDLYGATSAGEAGEER